jgi:hypothetical protein
MKNHERLQFLRGCGVAAFAVTAIFLVASQTCRAQGVGAPPSGAATASNTTQFPAIGALMEEVLANQDKLDKIHENYASNDMRIEEKLDKRGNVKKTTTYVYQVSFLGPNEIDRLIEKNGKALSTDEQKKEDERIAKDVEKYEKEQTNASAKQKEQDQAKITIQDFLRADRFSNPRRERRTGEELIAFDFAANPAFHAKTLTQRVAQALTGTIWIDEKAREVAELDAHFEKNVRVGGGMLASLHKGSAVQFVQTFVHSQVWLPTYISVHISARALLFVGVNVEQTDRYTDYKEFHVSSHSTLAPPKNP